MELATTIEEGKWNCRLKGHFTFSDSTRFQVLLEDVKHAHPDQLNLDFTNTVYIDSAALGMLLILKETAEITKTNIILSGARAQVLQVLKLSRFEELFTIDA